MDLEELLEIGQQERDRGALKDLRLEVRPWTESNHQQQKKIRIRCCTAAGCLSSGAATV